jgi:hypothetical protein
LDELVFILLIENAHRIIQLVPEFIGEVLVLLELLLQLLQLRPATKNIVMALLDPGLQVSSLLVG